MQQVIKGLKLFSLAVVLGLVFTNTANAQTPANDPGIGGPGVGTQPQGDGSPVVPFDGGMSLMLAASGIAYASKRFKKA